MNSKETFGSHGAKLHLLELNKIKLKFIPHGLPILIRTQRHGHGQILTILLGTVGLRWGSDWHCARIAQSPPNGGYVYVNQTHNSRE